MQLYKIDPKRIKDMGISSGYHSSDVLVYITRSFDQPRIEPAVYIRDKDNKFPEQAVYTSNLIPVKNTNYKGKFHATNI